MWNCGLMQRGRGAITLGLSWAAGLYAPGAARGQGREEAAVKEFDRWFRWLVIVGLILLTEHVAFTATGPTAAVEAAR